MLGPQEARGQEKPRKQEGEWPRGARGFTFPGSVGQAQGEGRAAGMEAADAERTPGAAASPWGDHTPPQPRVGRRALASPQPTGWAILACRLWWAMRWARCLKLLSHSPQPKGRSPVCTRRWSSR